ncbi:MAG: lipopolysaccharide biosynthesis protein [Alistipes sp.]
MNRIKKELISGVFYTSIAKYTGIIVSLAVTGVLARIFTPEQFGDVAVATVLITFFAIFSDIGIAPAIIQKKELDTNDLNHIFSFTVWSGLIVSILFFACSEAIASYYNSDVLANICRILTVNLLFSSLNIVPNALLFKEKRFRFVAIRSLSVQFIGGTAAIIAAYSGAGIYALTINPVLSSLLLFAINYHQHPLVLRLKPAKASLQKVFAFSAYQFFFNIINYFTRNLDKLLMGKYIDKSALGYYDKSYRLMMLPLQNITYVISPVMHPIFSELQNDLKQLSASYLKVVRFLAFLGFPLSAALFFTGKELILIIFGSQWEASIPAFQILALSVGIQILLSTSGSIFQAANATKTMFLSGVLSAVVTIGVVLIGIFAFGTIEAVAWCILFSFVINFIQCYYLLFCHTLHTPLCAFLKTLLAPLLATVCVCLPLAAVSYGLPALPLLPALLLKGIFTLVVWVAYIQLSGEYDLYHKLKEKLHR